MSLSRRLPFMLAAAVLVLTAVAGSGCGSQHPGSQTPSSSLTPSGPPASASTSSTPASSPPASPSAAAVPAVKAASVTFVSPSEAFVLGTARGQGTLLVRTTDRGATWTRLSAPVVPLGRAGSGSSPAVWGVRFATGTHGFIFGNSLWETTDGGLHWSPAAAPKGQILSLAAVRGQVLALVQSKPQSLSARLVRRALSGGAWSTVAAIKDVDLSDPTDLISTQAGTAAVLDGTGVLLTADGGATAGQVSPPTNVPAPYRPADVAVTSAKSLALLEVGQGYMGHTDKLVYASADSGATWVKAGKPSNEGDGGTLAGGSPDELMLATASAASWLDRSTDGGHSWTTVATYGDGGMGWADLGFTTTSDACVVHGPADRAGNSDHRPGQLLLSSDGGATWQKVRF